MTLSCCLFMHTFPVSRLRILMYFSALVWGVGSEETKHMPSLLQVAAKVNQTMELLQQVKLDTLINLHKVRIWTFQLKVPHRSLSYEPTTATNSVHWVASSLRQFPSDDLPSPWQCSYQTVCAYESHGPNWHVWVLRYYYTVFQGDLRMCTSLLTLVC